MSYRELIDALNKECEEKVRKIWQEAEAEAEKIRAEVSKRACEMKERYGRDRSSAARTRTDAILSEAGSAARVNRLRAEKELSRRLYQVAVHSLRHLRDERYRDVCLSLAHELPPGPWKVVRVNPEDREVARGFFPGSEILNEPGITGGLEVMGRKGSVRVVNTFEKRLERAWTEMLPEIMKDVYRELSE
ncbi:MAG: V-type ATP synthase subunit E [Nitrospirae bacterium]|nr:V-type ATP synthase subunit E [Nitrospirota bacterium]MCL5422796.1 V-type ATP synthase subunit E [Nitrospirota bacterium]